MEEITKKQIYIDDFNDDLNVTSSTNSSFGSYTSIVINKSAFIKEENYDIQNDYAFEKTKIGAGTFGTVYRATHRETGEIRAIKRISMKYIKKMDRFKTEVMALKCLDHPNIVKLYEVYYSKKSIYLVMEMCSGGELLSRIGSAKVFSEKEAAETFQQIVSTIKYCHQNRICHRDIKPENFMFKSEADNKIKLIDFGLSKFCDEYVEESSPK